MISRGDRSGAKTRRRKRYAAALRVCCEKKNCEAKDYIKLKSGDKG
jgi:hypothetical protein